MPISNLALSKPASSWNDRFGTSLPGTHHDAVLEFRSIALLNMFLFCVMVHFYVFLNFSKVFESFRFLKQKKHV